MTVVSPPSSAQVASYPYRDLQVAAHGARNTLSLVWDVIRSIHPVVAAGLLTLAAFGIRAIGLTGSFELWIDEMVYADLGAAVAHGQLPNLDGRPFFLHPPGTFLFDGLIMQLFGVSGDAMSVVYQMRWVNAALGAITVGLAFLIVHRVSTTPIAWFAATVLAFEPFVLRNNSRLFLETPAVAAVLGGLLVLVVGLTGTNARLSTPRAIVAGLLLGYGVLCKDMLVVLAIVPIVAAALWRATLPWRKVATVLAAGAIPYATYLAVVASSGHIGLFLQSKLTGVERMLGIVQTTGFNAPGAPSLAGQLIAQMGSFGTSYAFLLLGPVAGIAAFSVDPARRLIGLCAVSTGMFGVFAAVFGTFEEHFGYPVLVAGVLAVGAAAAEIGDRRPSWRSWMPWVAAATVALTVVLGIRIETTPDNGIAHVRAWVAQNLPAEARVGVTISTAQWAFRTDDRFGVWPSARSLRDHGANYVLTHSRVTFEGYGYAEPGLITWLEGNAQPLTRFDGPSNGQTVLWYIEQTKLDHAAAARIGSR